MKMWTLFDVTGLHLLQIWNIKPGWGSRPDMHVEKSHEDDITGLKFSSDGQILLSRSTDDTVKVSGFCSLLNYFLLYENFLMDLMTLTTFMYEIPCTGLGFAANEKASPSI